MDSVSWPAKGKVTSMVQLDPGSFAVDLSQWSDSVVVRAQDASLGVPRINVLPGKDLGQPFLREKEDLRIFPQKRWKWGKPS